jgi:hydroxyacylglutathione hydrolase
LLSCASVLAARTGATVHHGADAAGNVRYAQTVHEGGSFAAGKARLNVLQTAGLLFDSLRKLEALGAHAVLYPAHGAGSVCRSSMDAGRNSHSQ